MATELNIQDRIRREKEEWQGPVRPEVAAMTALVMLTRLLALIALVGWFIAA